MRITFLTHYPGRGGSTTMLVQLAEFFRRRGHAVTVVSGSDAENPLLKDYVVVAKAPRGGWRARMVQFQKTIEATQPDLLYVVSGKDEFDAARFVACPRVLHLCSIEQHEYIDIPFLLRQLHGYYEGIAANTPDVLEQAAAEFGLADVPGWIAPFRLKREMLAAAAQPLATPAREAKEFTDVCIIGRLEAMQKRVDWLPDIIAQSERAGAKLRWHFYGEGPEEVNLRRALAKNGCDQLAQFNGWVDPATFPQLLASHELFFLCSRWEGICIAMVEAMACGLAVVVPALPGGINYILQQGGGWLYEPDSPAAAVKALLGAVADPKLLRRKQAEARKTALALFNETAAEEQCLRLESELRQLKFNGRVAMPDKAPRLRAVKPGVSMLRRVRKLLGVSKKAC